MEALIGILGTLAGTILGWLLNNFSNRGKLNIYFASWEDKFRNNRLYKFDTPPKKENIDYYEYFCKMDVYNSSGDTKIMRNIQVCFFNDNKIIKTSVPLDNSTRLVTGQYTPVHYDEIGVINIPPKSAVSVNFHNGVWDRKENKTVGLDFLWDTKSIWIQYLNEKNKLKTIKVKDVNFLNVINDN